MVDCHAEYKAAWLCGQSADIRRLCSSRGTVGAADGVPTGSCRVRSSLMSVAKKNNPIAVVWVHLREEQNQRPLGLLGPEGKRGGDAATSS